MKATKDNVLCIIDEVMNNREIDSIRNAILAIRDKVLELEDIKDIADVSEEGTIIIKEPCAIVKIPLRNNSTLSINYDSAKDELNEFVCIDANRKIDTGIYGAMWYE